MGIKDIYYYFEEKYYNFLDKIPWIYPITDKIDAVIPSFIVVLTILALLLLMIGLFIVSPFLFGAQTAVSFAVKDNVTKNAIGSARIDLNVNDQVADSMRTGADGYSPKLNLGANDLISYTVTSNGYLSKTVRNVKVGSNELISVFLEPDRPDFRDVTVNFAVKGTNQPLRVPVAISFTCSPAQANVPPAQTVSANTPSVTVSVPSGCSKLLVNAQAQGYVDVSSYELFSPSTTIYFEERDDFKGTLNVQVTFNAVPQKGISVNVYEQSVGPIESAFTDDQGNVSFKLSPSGTYRVATTPTEAFGQASKDDIQIPAGETVDVTLELRSDVSAVMKLLIREGSKKISGAKVSVSLNGNRIDSKTTDANGDLNFYINQLGSYNVTVDHPDYLIFEKIIPVTQSGTVEQTLQLTKYTGQGTTISVKVLDAETSRAVKRARVALYRIGTSDNPVEEGTCNTGGSELVSAQGDLLDVDQYTDVNGLARFSRMSRGCYAAIAIRGGSFGKSDPAYFKETDTNSKTLNVALEIPRGAVRVNVVDETGAPVSFARVELFDDFDNSRLGGDVTTNDGVYELPATNANSKADKDVYVRVSAPEFSVFTSEAQPIIGGGVQTFNVILRKPLLQGDLRIVFEGLKAIDSNRVVKAGTNTIASGKTYHATWLVFVPEGQRYNNVVVHARTGKFELAYGELETDPSNFENVNMPLASIIKGTAIDPNNGEEADYQKVTADDFKWFNASFNSLGPGVYQLGADLHVKDTTILSDKVMLRWRASGELEDDEVRYPADASSPAGSLYANTDFQLYQVGTVTLCDADFCFDASIYDQVEQLVSSVSDEYEGKTGQGYRLSFSVSNNSTYKTYPDSPDASRKNRFVIENVEESLDLTNYQINSTQSFSNPSFNGTKIDVAIGDMGGGERGSLRSNITGNLDFLAKTPGRHSINFTFISKAQVVFQKTITINAVSNKTMDVNVSPTLLPAALENRLEIRVKDASTGIEIENAQVVAKDRFENVIGLTKTDRLGFSEMFLQGLEAGDIVLVTVSAPDYAPQVVPVSVSDQVVEVKPTDIGLTLNINAKFSDSKEIELKNWSQFPVRISTLEYIGNSEGLLDEAQIQNNLIQYFGLTIPAGESRKITFSTYLSEEGKLIDDLKQLTGKLEIKASNYGQTWTSQVNVKTSIGLGQLLDNENCLIVTPREWVNTSQGAPISQEFIVQNNCSVNGNPVAIRDLEAQVKWNSNPIGTFNVSIVGGDSSGALGSAEIREGYFKKLIGVVPAEKTYTMKVTFTPRGGVNGLADAVITLQSHNLTDGKSDQVLTQDIQAKLSTINVLECLTISKDLISITKVPNVPQATADFTIQNKTGCGEIEVTVSNYCRTENLSCDYLDVSPREFTLADGATSAAIQLVAGDATYPGQYAIKVSAKAKSQKLAQDITTLLERDKFIRVRVFDPEQCFLLSKYEFEVWDDTSTPADNEGVDRAVLTNNCPNKQLTVKIDTKQFFDAAQKSGLQQLLDILGYAAGTGLNYGINNGLLGGVIQDAVAPNIEVLTKIREKIDKTYDYSADAENEVKNAAKDTSDAKKKLEELKGNSSGTATAASVSKTIFFDEAAFNFTALKTAACNNSSGTAYTHSATVSICTSAESFNRECIEGLPTSEDKSIAKIKERQKAIETCLTFADKLVKDYDALAKDSTTEIRPSDLSFHPGNDQTAKIGLMVYSVIEEFGKKSEELMSKEVELITEKVKLAEDVKELTSNAEESYSNAQSNAESVNTQSSSIRREYGSSKALDDRSKRAIRDLEPKAKEFEELFKETIETEINSNEESGRTLLTTTDTVKKQFAETKTQLTKVKTDSVAAKGKVTGTSLSSSEELVQSLDAAKKQVVENSEPLEEIVNVKVESKEIDELASNTSTKLDELTRSIDEVSDRIGRREDDFPEEQDAQKFVPRNTGGGALANMAYCLNPARATMPNPYGGYSAYGQVVGQGIMGINPNSFNSNNAQGAYMQMGYAQNNCPPGNPFAQPNGFAEFFAQTMANLNEESILELQVVQPDVTFKSISVLEDQSFETDNSFLVAKESKSVIEPKKNTRLDVEKWNLELTNNLVNPDSVENRTTHFRTLQVTGLKFEYDTDKVYTPSDFKVKKPRTIEINLPVNPGPFDFLFTIGKNKKDRWTDDVITASDFDPNKATLKLVKGYPKDVQQNFHVQFNNISPFDQVTPDVPGYGQECIAFTPPGVTGITGVEALPRVKFEWNWSNQSIAYDECDFENDNGIYCDATQHSISLLKKVQVIREFLERNGANLRCPAVTNPFEGKSQEIGTDDIGIASLVPDVRGTDVNIKIEIQNRAPVNEPRSGKLTVLFKSGADNSTQSCERDVNVLYKEFAYCTFRAPTVTNYSISAKLENIGGCNSSTCDSNPNNNSISSSILIGPATITICPTPQQLPTMSANDIAQIYNTKNLVRFIEQSEREGITLDYENQVVPGLNKDKFVKVLMSDARLIQDGYSTDFQKDFDHYSQTDIFNAPEYYTIGSIGSDNTGLSRIFKDPTNWQFNIGATEGTKTLPGPGIYSTEILIGFDNPNWDFFSTSGEVTAKANIVMRKSSTTGTGQLSDKINPFYYMPFNGKVGTLEGDDGRTGYGLDFIGEAIRVDNEADGLTTRSIQSSTPYSDKGVVTVTASQNFLKVNQGEWADIRGQVLRVSRFNNSEISFSPSFATPVFLSLTNLRGEPCALYNLATINNSLVYTGTKATDWWGVGANCKDFFGQSVFDDTRLPLQDISNATTGNFKTICSSQINPGTYGVEWAGPQVKRGVVNLKTIFYTPQSNNNSIQLYTATDYARLVGQSVEGSLLPLNGVQGMRKNNPGDRIESIQDVFDLVESKHICVSSSPSEVKFWWNPTAIFRITESKEKNLARTCIQ